MQAIAEAACCPTARAIGEAAALAIEMKCATATAKGERASTSTAVSDQLVEHGQSCGKISPYGKPCCLASLLGWGRGLPEPLHLPRLADAVHDLPIAARACDAALASACASNGQSDFDQNQAVEVAVVSLEDWV